MIVFKPLPCPFCSTNDPLLLNQGEQFFYISCKNPNCSATGPKKKTLDKAIEFWNKISRKVIHKKEVRKKFFVGIGSSLNGGIAALNEKGNCVFSIPIPTRN